MRLIGNRGLWEKRLSLKRDVTVLLTNKHGSGKRNIVLISRAGENRGRKINVSLHTEIECAYCVVNNPVM